GPARHALSAGRVPVLAAAVLLGLGALPFLVLPWLVIPAARIVRGIPAGTLSWGLPGIRAGSIAVPTLAFSLAAGAAIALWLRLVARRPPAAVWSTPHLVPPSFRFDPPQPPPWLALPWLRLAFLTYAVLVVLAIVRQ